MPRGEISPTDIHVGQRLRALRLLKGQSQEYVADMCGISFQQVQKYEKGTNRLSASRMQQIAKCFNVEPSYFFDGVAGAKKRNGHEGGMEADLTAMATDRHGAKIVKVFMRLDDRKQREALATVVEEVGKLIS